MRAKKTFLKFKTKEALIIENFDQKIPIELISFYTYFDSDPKNVDKIKDKIDLVINKIKTKERKKERTKNG